MEKKKKQKDYYIRKLQEEFLSNCEELRSASLEIMELEQKCQDLSLMPQKIKINSNLNNKFSMRKPRQTLIKELEDRIVEFKNERKIKKKRNNQLSNQLHCLNTFDVCSVDLETQEVLNMISDLISRRTFPQLTNRLRASYEILQHNYEGAETYLRGITDNDISLLESIKSIKEIERRKRTYEQLEAKLKMAQARFNQMEKFHFAQIKQNQNNTEKTKNETEELKQLQIEKSLHEIEMNKTEQNLRKAKELEKEIKNLERKKKNLEEQINDKTESNESEILTKLKNDILKQEIEIRNEKRINKKLNEKYNELEKERNKLNQNVE